MPDEERYFTLNANTSMFASIETLPDLLSVQVKVSCGGLRSPCQFEVILGETQAICMFLSTVHKSPSEENNQFEMDKLLMQDHIGQYLEDKRKNEKLANDHEKLNTSTILL